MQVVLKVKFWGQTSSNVKRPVFYWSISEVSTKERIERYNWNYTSLIHYYY